MRHLHHWDFAKEINASDWGAVRCLSHNITRQRSWCSFYSAHSSASLSQRKPTQAFVHLQTIKHTYTSKDVCVKLLSLGLAPMHIALFHFFNFLKGNNCNESQVCHVTWKWFSVRFCLICGSAFYSRRCMSPFTWWDGSHNAQECNAA